MTLECKDRAKGFKTAPAISFELKALAGDEPEGTFEGYGSVFGNIDSYGDIVQKGAFLDSLKERMPALLWQHDPDEPIGVWKEAREDEKGLYVKGRLMLEGQGKIAYELLKMGGLNGLSIGFITKKSQWDEDTEIRTIVAADLWEVSLVTFGANELARVDSVKNTDIVTTRDLERTLRDAGFSRKEAKAVSSRYEPRSEKNLRDVGAGLAELKQRIERFETILKS